MKKIFDIFKTFDIFNSEALSIIKDKIIKFILIETNDFSSKKEKNFFITKKFDNSFDAKSYIKTDIEKDEFIYFSVLNNKKCYNLLTNTWRKYEQKMKNENIKR
ncbi:MAG: hypothetical protein V2B14_00780 [bacterium]